MVTLIRPTFAKIDLGALTHNYNFIKKIIPRGVKIMAMVKADAYGHGALEVSRVLEKEGVCSLGVATVEEGLELRNPGIKSSVIVMGGLMGAGKTVSRLMVDSGLTPVIHSASVIETLECDAKAAGKKVAVHVKIDTGMSRLGLVPRALMPVIEKLKHCRNLFIEGVMTHLAEASKASVSAKQMKIFLECKRRIENAIGPVKIWHIANSGALLRGRPIDVPDAKEVWARPGLSLYGDCEGIRSIESSLKPVMSILSRVVLIKNVPARTRVSYGGTYVTKRSSRLCVVPIGYADGYPWSVSGSARVLIRGRKAPVAGRVTMDMIVADVTDIGGVSVGDEVVLMGSQGDESIGVRDLARWAGTITYEIFCGISKRMPRIYI